MLRCAVVCGIADTASGFVLTGPAAVRRAGILASSVRSLRQNGLELRPLQAISSCVFSSHAGTLARRFATAGSGRSAAFPSVGRTLIAAGTDFQAQDPSSVLFDSIDIKTRHIHCMAQLVRQTVSYKLRHTVSYE